MNIEVDKLREIAGDLTVLICEDDMNVLEELEDIMSMFFEKVLVAHDGAEGLEIYKQHQDDIELIITDINMPNMNGLEMMAEVKKIDDSQKSLVLSAHDDLEYVLQIIELGINQFIPKPYDVDDLVSKIFAILEKLMLEQTIKDKQDSMVALIKTLEVFLLDEEFDREAFKKIIESSKEEIGIESNSSDFSMDLWGSEVDGK